MAFSLHYANGNLALIKCLGSAVCFHSNKHRQEKQLSTSSGLCQESRTHPTDIVPAPSLTGDQHQLAQRETAIISLHSSKFQLIKTASISALTEYFTLLYITKRSKSQESNKLLRFTPQSIFFQCYILASEYIQATPHLPFLILSQQV